MIMMLVGRSGVGKTTFRQAFNNQEISYLKTQSIEFLDNTIDTPGEYVENRALYRALMVTSTEAEVIILFQDCTDNSMLFAPDFAQMFCGKEVIGIVSKVDLVEDKSIINDSIDMLKLAGCEKVFTISSVKNLGLDKVRSYLECKR